ncbi:endonuclease domain-containing protein [Streptomyces zaomyceticus]|uniref:endonuclease domain-containing protein n=1 Tax=Streptomyces zaomyceticus TaxID=68286 RepID=UPI0034346532
MWSLAARRSNGAPQERDSLGRKQCARCTDWQPPAAFPASPLYADGLSSRCTGCRVEEAYGLSPERYAALLAEHDGKCAVCGEAETSGRALSVDHDRACCQGARSCGRCVRGLLCGRCNMGFGHMRDRSEAIVRAASYLTSWRRRGPRDAPEEPPRGSKGRLWSKYRVSIAGYEGMVREQSARCAVCDEPNSSGRALCVDHDHTCCAGKTSCGRCVRGLVCGRCNKGLGYFRDSPELLHAANAYLERYAAKTSS